MPDQPSLAITVRRSYLFSSAIIGFARVVINGHILLQEIPIFGDEEAILVQLSRQQVSVYPENMDRAMLNDVVWSCRAVIETAIVEAWKKTRNNKAG